MKLTNLMLLWAPRVRAQGRLARDGHGLPRISLGPAKPYPSMPCGLSQGSLLAAVFYPFRHPMPYAYVRKKEEIEGNLELAFATVTQTMLRNNINNYSN
jgi:hypothetical protein